MNKISKYEKKLEQRKIHNKGVSIKTSENLIRAFLGLFPPLGSVANMICSLKNAEKEQAIEDTIQFILGTSTLLIQMAVVKQHKKHTHLQQYPMIPQ